MSGFAEKFIRNGFYGILESGRKGEGGEPTAQMIRILLWTLEPSPEATWHSALGYVLYVKPIRLLLSEGSRCGKNRAHKICNDQPALNFRFN